MSTKKHNPGFPIVRYTIKALAITILLIITGLFGGREIVNWISSTYESQPTWQRNSNNAVSDYSESITNDAKQSIYIYFAGSNGKLFPQENEIPKGWNDYKKVDFIVRRLLRDPKSGFLKSAFPARVQLQGLFFIDNEISINLSKEMIDQSSGSISDDWLAISTLTNSILINLPRYESIKILIEGREVDTLKSGLDISQPLKQNFLLIAEK